MCDILLLDNQLAKFVIEHEKDMLHVKQRTTIIVHTRSAMTIQHCINPPNFTKQALLFINGAQIIGIHQHSWTPQSPDNFGRSTGRTVAAMYTHSPTGGPWSGAHPEILTSNITVTTGATGWVQCNPCLQHSPVRSVAAPCIIHRFLECKVTFQVKCTHRLDYNRTVWSFW